MILLLLAVVVLLALGGAGLVGIGVLSDNSRRDRTGFLAVLSAPVIVVVGAALLAVLMLGVGGMRAGNHESATEPVTKGQTPLDARVQRSATNIPPVVMQAGDADQFLPYLPVSGLTPDSVVRVFVAGFGRHEHGSVQQCVIELGRNTACAEPFPVQFDGEGRADFQFAVRGDVAPGGCRVGQPTCLLRVSGESPSPHAAVQTVLVDSVTPGAVRVEPARSVAAGQTVDVIVSGFPPLSTATAVLCAPPDVYDARRCAAPQPTSTFAIDAAGAGRTTVRVTAGRLGSDAALCGPRRLCGIAVVVDGGFITAPIAPVRFALGPGPEYEGARVLLGVVIALALIGAAVVIARRTDWTKPAEAATPDLDSSDLRTRQSLDDLFGTEEELDERDPILW